MAWHPSEDLAASMQVAFLLISEFLTAPCFVALPIPNQHSFHFANHFFHPAHATGGI